MPRPSAKKAAEDKNKAPAPVAAAPPPQPMMAVPPQAIQMQPPQHQVQPQHPVQHQMPMPHQQPPPVGAPPMQTHQGRVIDNESFVTVRDATVSRLSTILELLRSLTTDYIRQTNLLLGEPTADGAQGNLLANFENAAAQLMLPVADMAPPAEEKKERKKRSHDPNAPKRPLTPYFLYMQHARSIIANDLGPEAPKGAVQEEGQRRWASMNPQEKAGWNHAYQYNLRMYNARVHSYKAGNPDAKNMDDQEALSYADANGIGMPSDKEGPPAESAANDQDAIAQQLQQVAEAPTPAIPEEGAESKTPKKGGASRKRKSEAGEAPAPAATPAANASPDKKRRRASGKTADEKEEPKKSARKKTKSS